MKPKIDESEERSLFLIAKYLALPVAIFFGALALYSTSWSYSLTGKLYSFLGGVSTIGAERVMQGQLPYRDFWTMYSPGHFYLLGLLFRIFGSHLMVNVVAASIVCAFAASMCYKFLLNLTGKSLTALSCAAIFVAATYNTGYFKRLGSYPPAFLFILTALTLMLLYYKSENIGWLITAGLATGVVTVFKHDVGGYTAIAIICGLSTHHLMADRSKGPLLRALISDLAIYSCSVAVVVLPVLIYFALLAGADVLRDLVIFPLTDFRFARPEGYPSLLPFWIYDEMRLTMIRRFLFYVTFTVPFLLFVLGSVATVMAMKMGRRKYAAAGVMLMVGYLLHYSAAHIQINTHIITMSVYGFCLGAIFYELVRDKFLKWQPTAAFLLVSLFCTGWLLTLILEPAYDVWNKRRSSTTMLEVPKVYDFMVRPEEKRVWGELLDFVDKHVPASQAIFVGLHRHDVIVIGDVMIYFLLNRPIPTRYHELHPAVADTEEVQREIIQDLQSKDVSFIILKHIFSDKTLDRVKEDFLSNLPKVGATLLDRFIQEEYVKVFELNPYEIWKRKQDSLGHRLVGAYDN